MQSFYLRFLVYATENWPFFWNLSSYLKSSLIFFMQIRHMRAHFFGPYLSHITRETCIVSFHHFDFFSYRTCLWKKAPNWASFVIVICNYWSFKSLCSPLCHFKTQSILQFILSLSISTWTLSLLTKHASPKVKL